MRSDIRQRGVVSFPQFRGERIYMRPFTQKQGLPVDLKRWQPTVNQMLEGIKVDGPIYLMVDEGFVPKGETLRRPGLHVDGYWHPSIQAHGEGGHGSVPSPGRHGGGHRPRHFGTGEHESILLASNVFGCRGFIGEFQDPEWKDGDCSDVSRERLDAVDMEPFRVYAGHARYMLHESVPQQQNALRTVVRLNVPGWVM